ncbi:quinone-dependent dihydroorotate dehydrogenase [Gloeobacter violaceus]|uniref:Dihydroorotate dehydrogenase (quinone) n=1 Tax=Gloeobacter violaceus (strain ATCC 29082 / PCC 7421) TaxID=251221 RepID=PYRD_GLOVI|nr:quinone-dependent dihydroorotate dehydrogenase [Gloeobacter violaceus]Q7NC99.1 RecName: Full=Dihydroorotate dehydrogenase (quinone); AltName: Full=DHOdehase; Short=DHOD; Short=DHODase; AltName: Full=Dihydroorotate oxidase [Gloeobacter violaceus PCC 7421]BAC91021.1 dihydroorotate dehydrogenase [Gloeobacter violaceus PCC 7421]
MDLYRLARPLLFRADPEDAHRRALGALAWAAEQLWAGWLDSVFGYPDPRLEVKLWGLSFANPLGLAAGFDKNAEAVGAWEHLGFGFAEVGTVTRHAQPGNPRPRLFRLPADQAAINRMGFNNDGADALALRLAGRRWGIPIGINLGKSKVTPLEQASDDYLYSFERLYHLGDYFVVNVSSPNTPGLRELQQADRLGEILARLQCANRESKPLLVKIAPDLGWDAVDAVVDLCGEHRLAGVIATNTTIARSGLRSDLQETGGLSGAPLRNRSTEVIGHIWGRTRGQLPIVGVGGIFSGEDAWEKIAHGASLLQVYTGWIYEGPWMVRRILASLATRLERSGFEHLQQATGCAFS